jgi:hypothetical protein
MLFQAVLLWQISMSKRRSKISDLSIKDSEAFSA